MKDFLEAVWMVIRGGYYSVVLILGMLGIIQVIETSEPNEFNIVITIISFLAIGYGIRSVIEMIKE